MERENNCTLLELVELGSVSGETRGDSAPHWEAVGLQSYVGICDD